MCCSVHTIRYVSWWCAVLRRSAQNVDQKQYDSTIIKQWKGNENGFPQHGIVRHVTMSIPLLLIRFCILSVENLTMNPIMVNVRNAIRNCSVYFGIKTLCTENKSGFQPDGIVHDVNMSGWIRNK